MTATGFPQRVIDQIDDRSLGWCEVCGEYRVQEHHHRRPRGMGGSRRDDTAIAPSALPMPKNARTNPYVRSPSANRSATTNGRSTSMGPSTTSTKMLANRSVHSSHGVRHTNAKPSRRSRSSR